MIGLADNVVALDVEKDGQARLWWGTTPLDLFLSTTAFHDAAMERVRFELFAGRMVPFLACGDLAVFKAFFNHRRDWADMEDMVVAGSIDVEAVVSVLGDHLGEDDERVLNLRALGDEVGPAASDQ